MTETSNAIPISIISTDTALLRDCAWILESLGYDALVSTDWGEGAPWRQSTHPRLLLLDSRDRKQTKEYFCGPRRGAFVHRIAILSGQDQEDIQGLLRLGAEDVIRYPLNPCQLLARVRAGARRLEFERRVAITSSVNGATGIASRNAALRHLETVSAQPSPHGRVLLLVGVDHLSLIRREFGEHAANQSSSNVACCWGSSLQPADYFFSVSDGVFGLLLDSATDKKGLEVAQELSSKLATFNSLASELPFHLSVSAAVTPWDDGVAPSELLSRCMSALTHARSYGGNRTLLATEVEREVNSWRQRMETGELFQDVVAQDLMESFPIVLPQRDAGHVIAGWKRTGAQGAEDTSPPLIPVVCELGSMIGCVRPGTYSVANPPESVSLDMPLNELIEKLTAAEEGCLAVVDGNRPLGYVTNEGMASLMIDGLNTTTYQSNFDPSRGVSSLVVPIEPQLLSEVGEEQSVGV